MRVLISVLIWVSIVGAGVVFTAITTPPQIVAILIGMISGVIATLIVLHMNT